MRLRGSQWADERAWLQERARFYGAIVRHWTLHPATVLACLHVLFMLWVRSVWRGALLHYGLPVGPAADRASTLVSWVDFAVNWACEGMAYGGAHSTSPLPSWLLSLMGVRGHSDLALSVHWPLLLVLGTAQWFLVGLGIAFVRVRRRPGGAYIGRAGSLGSGSVSRRGAPRGW